MYKRLRISDTTKLVLKVLFGFIILCVLILLGSLVYFKFHEQRSVDTEEIYVDENLIFAQTVSVHIISINNHMNAFYSNVNISALPPWHKEYSKIIPK